MNATNNAAQHGPITSTFFYYMFASMLGLVAITTTSVVDGIFVGNYVGGDALASVTLLLPCFTTLYAVALALAIGGSVGAGVHIGEGDDAGASSVFSQTLIATLLFATTFALVSHGFEGHLYSLLGVPSELLPLVQEYFGVFRWVLIVQLTTMVLYYFVRADGHPMLATAALVTGSLTNIALCALFVGQWQLGLVGAAYATAVSQVIQAGVLSSYFFSKTRSLNFVWRQRQWSRLLNAAYSGVAEFINEISAGVIFWLLNYLLLQRTGVNGVAAFSVVNYYTFLSLMLSYGVADALHLLVSQNYGSGNVNRVRGFLRTALACSLTLGVLLASILVVWRTSVTGWFLGEKDSTLAASAAELATLVWPLYLANASNVIISCYLTAVQRPGPAAVIALLRGLVLPSLLLVTLHALPNHWSLASSLAGSSFLVALPLAEWLTFGLALVLCYRNRPAHLQTMVVPASSGQTATAAVPT
jgi:putative MATE family efflux protein